MDYSDEQLMLFYKSGQDWAFEELFRRHETTVERYIRTLTRWQDADIEDMVQDVFIRVSKGAATYVPKAKFSTWLYRIASNCCLNKIDVQKRHPYLKVLEGGKGQNNVLIPQQPDRGSPLCKAIEKEGLNLLHSVLNELKDDQRVCFTLRQIENLSYKDISQVLNVPEGTVKTNIFRARTQLVRKLGSYLDTEHTNRKEAGR